MPASAPDPLSATPAAAARTAPELRTVLSTPVDPAFGFSRIALTLSIPDLPPRARGAGFSEHVVDPMTRESTDTVIAVYRGGVAVSDDLGASWRAIDLPGFEKTNFVHSYTTRSGEHLLQSRAPLAVNEDDRSPESATVYLFDRDWKFVSSSRPGTSHWHGACSIDQAGDTIMFAEYPSNKIKYRLKPGQAVDPRTHDLRDPGVFRSRDGGRSWTKVYGKTWAEIRHFHTIAADPHVPGCWWLSSGDQAVESRVWRSDDDGDTWIDVSVASPELEPELYPGPAVQSRSVFRYTDIWIGQDELIWGADDWLGGSHKVFDKAVPFGRRAGSRMLRARKGDSLRPEILGYVGNPVRSMIDIGPAFLVLTEAKHRLMSRPQVVLMSKADPRLLCEIASIDNLSDVGTGFSFSRASRRAKDGVFFSFRARFDLFDSPTRMLRGKVDLY